MNRTIVITGGTGFLAGILAKHFSAQNDRVLLLTRNPRPSDKHIQYVAWDGESRGAWERVLEGSDVVINMAGKSVDCRYHRKNKKAILASRINATKAIGTAILACKSPPKIWLNSSSATIYRHIIDRPMDEYTGEIGSGFSVDVCRSWEKSCLPFNTPHTRKVLLRTAMVLGHEGGVLPTLTRLVKVGLGGKMGSGHQYVSWIHQHDFLNAIEFIIGDKAISGTCNLSSPFPIPNKQFMQSLRDHYGIALGIPHIKPILEVGALLLQTETELILKSRRVIPGKLLQQGYQFTYPSINQALVQLIS